MILFTNKEEGKITFTPEGIKDGYRIGMLREKCRIKQIPIVLSFKASDDELVQLSITKEDLFKIIGIEV